MNASRTEAACYSLFKVNTLFLAMFFFLGFWFLPKMPIELATHYHFATAVAGPSAFIFLNTHGHISL